MIDRAIDMQRASDGNLPSYAWPGGYPLYYLCEDGGVLCPRCVNTELLARTAPKLDKQWHVVAVQVNYEDPHLYCDHCQKQIPAAYE